MAGRLSISIPAPRLPTAAGRPSMPIRLPRSRPDSMQPIRVSDVGGPSDREHPIERFAIVSEQEPGFNARGSSWILGA